MRSPGRDAAGQLKLKDSALTFFTPSVRSSGHFLPKCPIAALPPSCLLRRPRWKYHLAIRDEHFKALPADPSSDYWRSVLSRFISQFLSFVAETASAPVRSSSIMFLHQPAAMFFATTDKYQETHWMYTSTVQTWRYLALIASCSSPYLR